MGTVRENEINTISIKKTSSRAEKKEKHKFKTIPSDFIVPECNYHVN